MEAGKLTAGMKLCATAANLPVNIFMSKKNIYIFYMSHFVHGKMEFIKEPNYSP